MNFLDYYSKYLITSILLCSGLLFSTSCAKNDANLIRINIDEWILFQERDPESDLLVRFAGLKINSKPLFETDEYSQEWKVIETTSEQIMVDQDVISEYDISLSLSGKDRLAIGYDDFTLLLFRKEEKRWVFSEYTNIQNRQLKVCLTRSEFVHAFEVSTCEWKVLPMIEDIPSELHIFQHRG